MQYLKTLAAYNQCTAKTYALQIPRVDLYLTMDIIFWEALY